MKAKDILDLHPLVRIAAMLIIGIVVGDALSGRVSCLVWLMLTAAALLLALAAYSLHDHARAYTQGWLIMVTNVLLGATLVAHANEQLRFTSSDGKQDYEAVVTSEPQVKGKTSQFDMLITAIDGHTLRRPLSVKASLLRDTLAHRWQQLHVGSGIEAYSQLETPENYYPDSHFDYIRWLHVHGYRAQTFIFYNDWQAAPAHLSRLSLWQRVRLRALTYRQSLLTRYRALGFDGQQLALIAAMTLGDKSALSKDTKDDYSITGGAHVLALSGLHLGIIYALLTLVLGRVRRWRWACQSLVLVAVWIYVVMVGLPVSALRSATMLTVCSLCLLLGRRQVSVNVLAFAAIVLLIANPLSLWDVGFQLSFLSVLSIHLYTGSFYKLLHLNNRLLKWAWGIISVSLAAQIGTAPLVMYYFGRFSCYFLLTNFIVIPMATVILYAAVVMLAVSPFLMLQKAVATILLWTAGWMNTIISWMAAWPGASIEGIRLSLPQLFLMYVMIAALSVIIQRVWQLRRLQRLDVFNKHDVKAKDLPPVEIFDWDGSL